MYNVVDDNKWGGRLQTIPQFASIGGQLETVLCISAITDIVLYGSLLCMLSDWLAILYDRNKVRMGGVGVA